MIFRYRRNTIARSLNVNYEWNYWNADVETNELIEIHSSKVNVLFVQYWNTNLRLVNIISFLILLNTNFFIMGNIHKTEYSIGSLAHVYLESRRALIWEILIAKKKIQKFYFFNFDNSLVAKISPMVSKR